MKSRTALAAALAVAAASVACAHVATPRDRGHLAPSPAQPDTTGVSERAVGGVPMTVAAARHLPAGVFYILGGPRSSSMNVWRVSNHGALQQLTRNPAGAGIDEMSASPAGIVVGDGLDGGEQAGVITRHGVVWVRPWHKPHGFIYGFGIRITNSGQLLYLLAPGQGTDPGSKVFTYWRKPSLEGREHVIYRSRQFIGGPLPGPRGRIAIVGPSGQTARGQKPGIMIISRSGRIRRVAARMKEMGYPTLWGETAPALVVPSARGPAQLVFLDGRRMTLPARWQPWSWNPAGTELLMLKGTTLGIWSLARPRHVIPVTTISPGFEIEDISWLAKPASLDPR